MWKNELRKKEEGIAFRDSNGQSHFSRRGGPRFVVVALQHQPRAHRTNSNNNGGLGLHVGLRPRPALHLLAPRRCPPSMAPADLGGPLRRLLDRCIRALHPRLARRRAVPGRPRCGASDEHRLGVSLLAHTLTHPHTHTFLLVFFSSRSSSYALLLTLFFLRSSYALLTLFLPSLRAIH